MEELVEKYCNEICNKCDKKDSCRPVENIVYIEDGKTHTVLCDYYKNQRQIKKLCRLMKKVDK